MEILLEFIKNYFVFMLILFLFSYLAPKENYQKYFNFFISVLMVAILVRPLIYLMGEDGRREMEEEFSKIEEELDNIVYYEKGESMIEQIIGKTTGAE
jgi:hypothetical protein